MKTEFTEFEELEKASITCGAITISMVRNLENEQARLLAGEAFKLYHEAHSKVIAAARLCGVTLEDRLLRLG